MLLIHTRAEQWNFPRFIDKVNKKLIQVYEFNHKNTPNQITKISPLDYKLWYIDIPTNPANGDAIK